MIVSIPSYALGIKLNQTDDFAQTPIIRLYRKEESNENFY